MQTCETVNEHDSSELSLAMHCDLTGDYLQIPNNAGSHHCIMPKCSKHNHKHNGMIGMKILLQRMFDVEHIYDMKRSLHKYTCFCTVYMLASELHKLCHPAEIWSPVWCICICKRHTKRTVFVYSVFIFIRIMQIDLCRDYHGLSMCIKAWDPCGPTSANVTSRITMHCYDGDDD